MTQMSYRNWKSNVTTLLNICVANSNLDTNIRFDHVSSLRGIIQN